MGAAIRFIAGPFFYSTTTIQRFSSVEEQWVFAAQIGTSAAWRSVIDYFPDKTYWRTKAERQLAYAYGLEGRTVEALAAFEQFASSDVAFWQAGLAWCLAQEGKIDQAASLLSELRSSSVNTYDRLTEDILSKTVQLIRRP